jgi:hypothetical protein
VSTSRRTGGRKDLDERPTDDEVLFDPDAATHDGTSWLLDDDLEFHGSLMGGAVVLRGRQKAGVVPALQTFHQVGNELIGWQTRQRSVLGRHNKVKASDRRGYALLMSQAAQRRVPRGLRDAKRVAGLRGAGLEPASSHREPCT